MSDLAEITVAETSNAAKAVGYDINHPYHLNNSDSPGMTLVNIVFDGRGYQGWERSILLSLSAKKRLGFINGACKSPDMNSAEYEQYIKGTLGQLGAEVWQSNSAKLYHLQKELSSLVQGNSDIARYFTKLKWDELDALNARGNILMMSPLPSMDIAYTLLLQNKNQREVYANAHFSSNSASFMVPGQGKHHNAQILVEFATIMVTRHGRSNQRFRNQTPRRAIAAQRFNNSTQKVAKPQQKFKGKKKHNPNVSCTYCGKIRHTQEACYRLIEFPNDFEFTNPKTYQNQVKKNVVTTHEDVSVTGQNSENNSNSFGQ
ncbi:uncharacterized protein [Nicotiana tomentosiformis]|uniref:uncharacterized protein n=1 Tax=Nicotiana tomentosiformis TaxID=4098 RepID=UPI00388CCEB2